MVYCFLVTIAISHLIYVNANIILSLQTKILNLKPKIIYPWHLIFYNSRKFTKLKTMKSSVYNWFKSLSKLTKSASNRIDYVIFLYYFERLLDLIFENFDFTLILYNSSFQSLNIFLDFKEELINLQTISLILWTQLPNAIIEFVIF